jgi:hypothetical protein
VANWAAFWAAIYTAFPVDNAPRRDAGAGPACGRLCAGAAPVTLRWRRVGGLPTALRRSSFAALSSENMLRKTGKPDRQHMRDFKERIDKLLVDATDCELIGNLATDTRSARRRAGQQSRAIDGSQTADAAS